MSSTSDSNEVNRDTNTVDNNDGKQKGAEETELEKANKKIESGNDEC